LSWDLEEGDDLHPAANVAKMTAGHPLTDADRAPWLDRVAGWIQHQLHDGRCGIITCSALKRSYRDRLQAPGVTFVYLHGTYELIAARLSERRGHYMPPGLLDSQFADLEPPGPDEDSLWVDVRQPTADQVKQIVEALRLV
jgi:gluconokinase